MNALERRIIDISYKSGLSHIGSCLTCVNLIDDIYAKKLPEEPFILSNGHAGLALYVVLEKYRFGNAEEMFARHGVHPNRDMTNGIHCSAGSLGHGIGIAVGMALADRTRNVYVMVSDGECAEGSLWESLRIASEQKLDNLKVTVNANGFGAYQEIDLDRLEKRLKAFFPVSFKRTKQEYLFGLDAHYHVLTAMEYERITKDE